MKQVDRKLREAEAVVEPRLKQLGLTSDQVEAKSPEELEESLVAVDEAIRKADSLFGVVPIRRPDGATAIDRKTGKVVNLVPQVLLRRKRRILERIQESGEDALRQAPNGSSAEEARAGLQAARSASSEVQNEIDLISARMKQIDAENQAEEAKAQREDRAARSRADRWLSFLAREPVACVVGAVLLLILGASLVVAMFLDTTPATVISNAFLLILGYFFGQSVVHEREGLAEPTRPSASEVPEGGPTRAKSLA